jgi:hypothetical protein
MDKEFLSMQRDSMQMAKEYIDKFLPGIDKATESFRLGNNDEGVEICSYVEEGLQWLIEIARLTKDVQSEEMDEALMEEKSDMLVEAYENEDFTLMGDILEFEIKPILTKWNAVIKGVAMN